MVYTSLVVNRPKLTSPTSLSEQPVKESASTEAASKGREKVRREAKAEVLGRIAG
ncbi:hypothetical protein LRP50_19970 [Enterovibrio sp. ZSDZ42]|uniref:Uncharacterized protein n=1 Tax=Enterovibrio gelatinilyticus TaxID=2899819 RepID=A0ABT5R548_9GAMM|nr:hypothetical protein [Enterovibrio sp. ZSDZ42]MDD1795412.1 hypothetical protein [Enterovibrio sp. ZSDZ42]